MIPARPSHVSGSLRGCLRAAPAALALLLSGCGAAPQHTAPPAHSSAKGLKATVGATESGLASYYADSLAGNSTASGEPYNPRDLTAAHRTLPFGTLVEVSREDGSSVVVRINDRGPFGHKKRIIDLSRGAAEKIGLVRAGVAKVTLRILGTR